jgi:NAD(P)H-dependent FMN reductase
MTLSKGLANLNIGIVLGSIHEDTFDGSMARWLQSLVGRGNDISTELFTQLPSAAAAIDGLVIVTREYNHGPSAALLDALKHAGTALAHKPVAFIGHGRAGRSVEKLRLAAAQFRMVAISPDIHLGFAETFAITRAQKTFDDFAHLRTAAREMLSELEWWARACKQGRGVTLNRAARGSHSPQRRRERRDSQRRDS